MVLTTTLCRLLCCEHRISNPHIYPAGHTKARIQIRPAGSQTQASGTLRSCPRDEMKPWPRHCQEPDAHQRIRLNKAVRNLCGEPAGARTWQLNMCPKLKPDYLLGKGSRYQSRHKSTHSRRPLSYPTHLILVSVCVRQYSIRAKAEFLQLEPLSSNPAPGCHVSDCGQVTESLGASHLRVWGGDNGHIWRALGGLIPGKYCKRKSPELSE